MMFSCSKFKASVGPSTQSFYTKLLYVVCCHLLVHST